MSDEAEKELASRRLSAAICSDSGEMLEQLQAENQRLREAIRRLAEQDATLSVCDGNVTVTMDATLTDAEREAVERAQKLLDVDGYTETAAILRGLLERTVG